MTAQRGNGRSIIASCIVGLALLSFPASATKQDTTYVTPEEQAEELPVNDRRHPDYVRCRNYSVIGSLAKKRRVCMTNREWVVYIRESNKRSRELMEDGQPRATDEFDPRLAIDKFGTP